KLWSKPRGLVCLMILTSPQLETVWFSSVTSLVVDTKLLPDERDSHTVWANATHWLAGMMSAMRRLIPNSANSPALIALLLIGLFAAVMAAVLAAPSAPALLGDCTVAPQHGARADP